jgi:hypothetical protein
MFCTQLLLLLCWISVVNASANNTSFQSEIASYEITTIPNLITSSLRLQPGADLKKALLKYYADKLRK